MVKFLRLRSRKNKKKQVEPEQPKSIMDIIEEDYPDRYESFKEMLSQYSRMFTREEWLSILTRSRTEHERYLPKNADQKRKD